MQTSTAGRFGLLSAYPSSTNNREVNFFFKSEYLTDRLTSTLKTVIANILHSEHKYCTLPCLSVRDESGGRGGGAWGSTGGGVVIAEVGWRNLSKSIK